MIIYFSIYILILFCGLIWGQNERDWMVESRLKNVKPISILIPYVLIFGYISFLAAMRTNINDTGVYRRAFVETSPALTGVINGLSHFSLKTSAFNIVTIVFKRFISTNYHLFFGLFSVIESIVIIRILRRESVSFFDSCYYLFTGGFCFNYFTMMRQWFAVVLVFSGVFSLANKRLIHYVIICIIAGLFHPSALLMIPVYFLVQGNPWSNKQIGLIAVFVLLLPFLNSILSGLGEVLEGSSYDYVFDSFQTNSGSSWVRILISGVPVALSFIYLTDNDDTVINICVNMAIISFLLNVLATFTNGLYVIRFSTYTSIFNLILYPYLLNVSIRDDKNSGIIRLLFYVLFIVLYYYNMSRSGSFYYGSDILGTFQ